MGTPLRPWDGTALQNNGNMLRSSNIMTPGTSSRVSPSLPPRPQSLPTNYNSPYSSSYGSNYGSSYGYGSGYSSSYGGYGNAYRSPMYNSYASNYGGFGGGYGGGYGGYGSPMYGGANTIGGRDDAETRFIQFAEESSRNTFANVESVVRAFNSVASMMDNTLFAMTSSFRAILGVAENVHRLRSTFAQIFHAVNVFRLVRWFYRTFLRFAGFSVPQHMSNAAWNEAAGAIDGAIGAAAGHSAPGGASAWPTLAFIAALVSIPYIITKMLPKYEDNLNPEKWRSSGIRAKVAFDFAASSSHELTIHTNDEILLAPKHIQEEMRLTNSGWAYATTCNNDKCGVVPLNYIIITRKSGPAAKEEHPISPHSKVQKRVTFGENQIFDDDSPAKRNQNREMILNKIKNLDANKENSFRGEEDSTITDIPLECETEDSPTIL